MLRVDRPQYRLRAGRNDFEKRCTYPRERSSYSSCVRTSLERARAAELRMVIEEYQIAFWCDNLFLPGVVREIRLANGPIRRDETPVLLED